MNLIAPRTYELDDEERKAYELIQAGKKVNGLNDRWALLRLRRNGLIENHGSRARPEWKLSDNWKSWPYSYLTTIVLPNGETNADPYLVEINELITVAEDVLESLKQKRDAYTAKMEERVVKLRVDPNWRKFERPKKESNA